MHKFKYRGWHIVSDDEQIVGTPPGYPKTGEKLRCRTGEGVWRWLTLKTAIDKRENAKEADERCNS